MLVSTRVVCFKPTTYHEVELLRLLLVGPPLSDARFAEIRLRHSGFDRLGGPAVVETLGHVVVFDGHHVLDGGQGGLRCLFDLVDTKERGKMRRSRLSE